MPFEENKHPRDSDGKFTDKDSKSEVAKTREAVKKYSDSPAEDMAAMGVSEKPSENDDDTPKFGSQEELDKLLGEEFQGVKGQAAIDKLLKEKRGHVKGAFHRDDIGDIDLFWGDENVGLHHIIKQRLDEKSDSKEKIIHAQDVLDHINETVSNGVFRKQNKRGDMEFVYKGYGVAIAPAYHGNKITYLLTAYKNEKSAPKNK